MPTTTEAAALLGCAKCTVTRAAKRYQIGSRHGPLLAFTAADIERLRPLVSNQRGNPRIGEQSAKGVAARKKRKKAKP